jgi:hypothetical protein
MSNAPRIDRLDKNYLINGNFDFWQRTVSNDLTVTINAAYGADRWKLFPSITNSNAAHMQRASSSNSGSQYDMNLGAFGVANAKCAAAQIVEFDNTKLLRNKEVTFSAYVKNNNVNPSTVRLHIIAWTGTANVITAFTNAVPYTDWSTYALASNFVSVAATSKVISGVGAYTKVVVSGTIPAGATNIVCVMSYDSGIDQVYWSQAQLIAGTHSDPDFSPAGRNISDELLMCQRFYDKSYDLGIVPGTATNVGNIYWRQAGSVSGAGVQWIAYKTGMRSTPTVSLFSPQTGSGGSGGSARFYNDTQASDRVVGVQDMSVSLFVVNYSSASNGGTTIGDLNFLRVHWTADAEL